MKYFMRFMSIVAWGTATLVSVCEAEFAAQVQLYSGVGRTIAYQTFKTPHAQWCYSVVPCFNDRTRSGGYRSLPGQLVLYDGAECQGEYHVLKGENGGFSFSGDIFESGGGVSSFMIWATSIYATAGMSNACYESTQLDTLNSTLGSGSGE